MKLLRGVISVRLLWNTIQRQKSAKGDCQKLKTGPALINQGLPKPGQKLNRSLWDRVRYPPGSLLLIGALSPRCSDRRYIPSVGGRIRPPLQTFLRKSISIFNLPKNLSFGPYPYSFPFPACYGPCMLSRIRLWVRHIGALGPIENDWRCSVGQFVRNLLQSWHKNMRRLKSVRLLGAY